LNTSVRRRNRRRRRRRKEEEEEVLEDALSWMELIDIDIAKLRTSRKYCR